MKLSGIYIYPVKSLGPVRLTSSEIDEGGLKYDRRWMIIDKDNCFISQRTCPGMSQIDVFQGEESFTLRNRKDNSEISIPRVLAGGEQTEAVIWSDRAAAFISGNEANEWISGILKGEYRFVYMPETALRRVEDTGGLVSFADAYPFLLIGQSSLDDLNLRTGGNIEMIRFRPNLVVTGGIPYEEDGWEEFTIGTIPFVSVKPCTRCSIPSIDPATGDITQEPLRTLSGYRRRGNKVIFGMNLISKATQGELHIGDAVTVEKRKQINNREVQ